MIIFLFLIILGWMMFDSEACLITDEDKAELQQLLDGMDGRDSGHSYRKDFGSDWH